MKPIYTGMYKTEDLDGERRRLEDIITNYQPQEFLANTIYRQAE